MLKVKVEPVDPSLRGDVPLPNGPGDLSDYQLYYNPGLVRDAKTEPPENGDEVLGQTEDSQEMEPGNEEDGEAESELTDSGGFIIDEDNPGGLRKVEGSHSDLVTEEVPTGQDSFTEEVPTGQDSFTIEEGESNVIETLEEAEVALEGEGRLMMVGGEQQDNMTVQEIIEVPYLASGEGMSNVIVLEEEGTTQYIITDGQTQYLTEEAGQAGLGLPATTSAGHNHVVVERLQYEDQPFISPHSGGSDMLDVVPHSDDSDTDMPVRTSPIATLLPHALTASITSTGKDGLDNMISKKTKAKLIRQLSHRQVNESVSSGNKSKRKRKSVSEVNSSKAKQLKAPVAPNSTVIVPGTPVVMPQLLYSQELNAYVQVLPVVSDVQPKLVAVSANSTMLQAARTSTSLVQAAKPAPSTPTNAVKLTAPIKKQASLSPIQKRHPLMMTMLSRGPIAPIRNVTSPASNPAKPSCTLQRPNPQATKKPSATLSAPPSEPETSDISIVEVTSLAAPCTSTITQVTPIVQTQVSSSAESDVPRLAIPLVTMASTSHKMEPVSDTEAEAGLDLSQAEGSEVFPDVIPEKELENSVMKESLAPPPYQPPQELPTTSPPPPYSVSSKQPLLKVPSVIRRKKSTNGSMKTAPVVLAKKSPGTPVEQLPELKARLSVSSSTVPSVIQSQLLIGQPQGLLARTNMEEAIDLTLTDPKERVQKTGNETLADRYMREWKPTGKFQCKFCVYSCVTQNFLFRHWVQNHSGVKPYICGHCEAKSPTRDGITRHMTTRHRNLDRNVVVDSKQERLLVQRFKEVFTSMFSSQEIGVDLLMPSNEEEGGQPHTQDLPSAFQSATHKQQGKQPQKHQNVGQSSDQTSENSTQSETDNPVQLMSNRPNSPSFIIILNNESGTITLEGGDNPGLFGDDCVSPPFHPGKPSESGTEVQSDDQKVATQTVQPESSEHTSSTERATVNMNDCKLSPTDSMAIIEESPEKIHAAVKSQSLSVFDLLEHAKMDRPISDRSTSNWSSEGLSPKASSDDSVAAGDEDSPGQGVKHISSQEGESDKAREKSTLLGSKNQPATGEGTELTGSSKKQDSEEDTDVPVVNDPGTDSAVCLPAKSKLPQKVLRNRRVTDTKRTSVSDRIS